MEIIKTPWKDKFLELASKSQKSIKITSPFIKNNICEDMLNITKEGVNIDLITSYKIFNIYSGSLDLDGLEKILNHNGIIRNYSKLHAKIYLFDDKKAVITSGNLTNGGLLNNFEYGVYFDDVENIKRVIFDFSFLVNNEKTGIIEQNHIEKTRQLLKNIQQTEKVLIPIQSTQNEIVNDILKITEQPIIKTLTGWNKEVFNCISSISTQEFDLQTIYSFEPNLKQIYPNNNFIKDKIRQQLQLLRDIGLIEFLENGRYRKLWS